MKLHMEDKLQIQVEVQGEVEIQVQVNGEEEIKLQMQVLMRLDGVGPVDNRSSVD